jgi:hypothetical protein
MQQLMGFLAMDDVPYGDIGRVSESTGIPTNAIRFWRRELLKDVNWGGHRCSPHPGSRAVSVQQESDMAASQPIEYVSAGQYCRRAIVNSLALAINAELRIPECDIPLTVTRGDLES